MKNTWKYPETGFSNALSIFKINKYLKICYGLYNYKTINYNVII